MDDDKEVFGWFAKENRETLETLIQEHQIKTVVEIGSFLGLSAIWFAKRVEHVWCVDKFMEVETQFSENNLVDTLKELNLPATDFYPMFEANIAAAGVQDKITVVRGWSHQVHAQVPDADLIYIDGDHSASGCFQDIVLYRPKAVKVICGDDFTPRFPGVLGSVRRLLPGHVSIGPFWYQVLV